MYIYIYLHKYIYNDLYICSYMNVCVQFNSTILGKAKNRAAKLSWVRKLDPWRQLCQNPAGIGELDLWVRGWVWRRAEVLQGLSGAHPLILWLSLPNEGG